MPFLRELKLNNCDDINISSMAALSQCVTLEVNIGIPMIQNAFIFSRVKRKLDLCISILIQFFDSDNHIGFMCSLDGCYFELAAVAQNKPSTLLQVFTLPSFNE